MGISYLALQAPVIGHFANGRLQPLRPGPAHVYLLLFCLKVQKMCAAEVRTRHFLFSAAGARLCAFRKLAPAALRDGPAHLGGPVVFFFYVFRTQKFMQQVANRTWDLARRYILSLPPHHAADP